MVADICAWHGTPEGSDKKAADEWALACGYELNHTICPACKGRLIDGELTKPDKPKSAGLICEPKKGDKPSDGEGVSNEAENSTHREATEADVNLIKDWIKRNS
jgi:hypothetical protein